MTETIDEGIPIPDGFDPEDLLSKYGKDKIISVHAPADAPSVIMAEVDNSERNDE